ncbi:hypothetical protein [Arthrobacter sp. H5]|uniref:hypothetical protein n=1 Tax=Arthrobacter sp. H5 TaxID=1267973 RepID=UPI0004BBEBA2|nr:hypothetical protein [Arthrobacter sp. H5]
MSQKEFKSVSTALKSGRTDEDELITRCISVAVEDPEHPSIGAKLEMMSNFLGGITQLPTDLEAVMNPGPITLAYIAGQPRSSHSGPARLLVTEGHMAFPEALVSPEFYSDDSAVAFDLREVWAVGALPGHGHAKEVADHFRHFLTSISAENLRSFWANVDDVEKNQQRESANGFSPYRSRRMELLKAERPAILEDLRKIAGENEPN